MPRRTYIPEAVREQVIRKLASLGGKLYPKDAHSAAGKRGMLMRWKHLKRCPTCHRPVSDALIRSNGIDPDVLYTNAQHLEKEAEALCKKAEEIRRKVEIRHQKNLARKQAEREMQQQQQRKEDTHESK